MIPALLIITSPTQQPQCNPRDPIRPDPPASQQPNCGFKPQTSTGAPRQGPRKQPAPLAGRVAARVRWMWKARGSHTTRMPSCQGEPVLSRCMSDPVTAMLDMEWWGCAQSRYQKFITWSGPQLWRRDGAVPWGNQIQIIAGELISTLTLFITFCLSVSAARLPRSPCIARSHKQPQMKPKMLTCAPENLFPGCHQPGEL